MLAFSAVANHDRVGAVLFTDRIEGYVPPRAGRDHALRIVRDLLAREPEGRGTDLAGALRFAQRVLRRRGIVAVLSDFQAEGYERALGVLRRRHDVVALHLADPREGDVPDAGLVALQRSRDRRARRGRHLAPRGAARARGRGLRGGAGASSSRRASTRSRSRPASRTTGRSRRFFKARERRR